MPPQSLARNFSTIHPASPAGESVSPTAAGVHIVDTEPVEPARSLSTMYRFLVQQPCDCVGDRLTCVELVVTERGAGVDF